MSDGTDAPDDELELRASTGHLLALALGSVALIAGCFLPWLNATAAFFGSVSRSGVNFGGDAWLLAGLGALCLFVTYHGWQGGFTRITKFGLVALAAVALLTALYDASAVRDRKADLTSGEAIAIVDYGVGLYMVCIGPAVVLLAAVLLPSAPRQRKGEPRAYRRGPRPGSRADWNRQQWGEES